MDSSQQQGYGGVRFSDGQDGRTSTASGVSRDSMQRSHSDSSHRLSSAGRASFLRTVKKVQISRRMEKLAKMRSESHIGYMRSHRQLVGTTTTVSEDESLRLVAPPAGAASERSLAESASTTQHLIQIVTGKGIVSLCLLAGPLALAANAYDWSDTAKFWLNFVTMIPLASILGDFTEEVALHTNETIGGLINATFGVRTTCVGICCSCTFATTL